MVKVAQMFRRDTIGSDAVAGVVLGVGDDGSVITDKDALAKASVTAKVIGESKGPKVDIFKYKNKTGYRRRQGHRQKYTTIEVTGIKDVTPIPHNGCRPPKRRRV